jgi:hypothetical protein
MKTTTNQDTKEMMTTLLDLAKHQRESFKYSGDEQMLPMAFIYGDEITIMMLGWKDNKEKYQMAASANMMARTRKAQSLSFVTDSRWINSDAYGKYYNLPAPKEMGVEKFMAHYKRTLAAHGGEMKNLPREIWDEAVVVFTNGPGIPITIQMAPYKEGPNDTIEWMPTHPEWDGPDNKSKSDMLTDWWS